MRPVPVSRLVILAVLACAAVPAFAGERIAVVATGLEAQAQLDEVFCVSQTCIPAEKVLTGGRVDSKKLQRERVKYTVVAAREKKGLLVQLKDRDGKVRYEQEVDAGVGGKISVGPLVTLAANMINSIENGTTQAVAEKSGPDEAKLKKMRAWAKRQQLAKAQKAAAKKKKFAARGKSGSPRG